MAQHWRLALILLLSWLGLSTGFYMPQCASDAVSSEATKPAKDPPAVHKKGMPATKHHGYEAGGWHAKSDAAKAAKAKRAASRLAPRQELAKKTHAEVGTEYNKLTIAERHRRIVVMKGNTTDPYERVQHIDDRVSGYTNLTLDFRAPICATEVKDGDQTCTLLSQRLCSKTSSIHRRTSPELGECFARRESCAVVGSSGHLLDADWGKLIDNHSIVIRMNRAPAGSNDNSSKFFHLSEHVGTRTSVRFVNELGEVPDAVEPPMCLLLHQPALPESCGEGCSNHPAFCNVTCSRTTRAICSTKRCDLDQTRCVASRQQKRAQWEHHQVFLDNAIGGLTDAVVPHATAGFKAVMHAMSICDSVSIFGFGPTCHGELGGRYYTENDVGPSTLFHHYSEELGLLLRADELGANAIIPPEARMWITAKSVKVMLPKCVNRIEASRLTEVLQRVGGSSMEVELASGESFNNL